MTTPLPSCLALPPRKAHVLPVEDAWSIAQHWHHRMKRWGYSIVLERSSNLTVTQGYKWIGFGVYLKHRAHASLARAAAVTWFALSCCPGYGDRENPVFWKCVFGELEHTQRTESITDEYGFFDRDGVDFPRFKIDVKGMDESNLLLFCGHPDHELERNDKVQLGELMEFLEPWVNQERARRRPVVSFKGDLSDTIDIYNAPTEWPLSRVITNVNQSTSPAWSSPVFQVQDLDFPFIYIIDETCALLQDALRSHEVETAMFHNFRSGGVSRVAMASMVSAVMRLPGSGVRARTTALYFDSSSPLQLVRPFLSALPLTTSIKSVTIRNDWVRPWFLKEAVMAEMVWIAYALFHPDTPASPWTSLSIQDNDPSGRWLAVLQAMASGNNLAALLEKRTPTSDGYYRARLVAGAVVYDRGARPFMSLRSKRSALVKSDGNLVVDVCDVASDNPKRWPRWIAVVVPAYGLGWTRSANVGTVDKRPAAVPSLRRLLLHNVSKDRRPRDLERLLSTIGRRLEHLDVGGYVTFQSSAEIAHTLRSCPAIKSLVIYCFRSPSTRWDLASSLPHLRELELQLSTDSADEGFDLPASLQVLRLRCLMRVVDNLYASTTKHILSQPSQLRFFQWKNRTRGERPRMLYTESRAETSRQLEELQVPSNEHVDISLPAACAAAFLSVLVQPGRSSTLTRLDLDVVKTIVAFAGTRQTRLVVLEPIYRPQYTANR